MTKTTPHLGLLLPLMAFAVARGTSSAMAPEPAEPVQEEEWMRERKERSQRNREATKRKPERRTAPTRALQILYERDEYAALGEEQVGDLASLAEAAWPTGFAGMRRLRVERFGSQPTNPRSGYAIAVYLHEPSGLEFSLVPGGLLYMGSSDRGSDRVGDPDEEPIHRVVLDPFLIARTECTRAAWRRVMEVDPSYFVSGSEAYPVESVSHFEALEWCKTAGMDLGLPTEAQWEYACLAGARDGSGNHPYGLGYKLKTDQARIAMDWTDGPTEVRQYEPNRFGIFDVHGNIWEWCADWRSPYYEAVEPGTGLRSGKSLYRVARGGSFIETAREARAANRYAFLPGDRRSYLGFRPARVLTP